MAIYRLIALFADLNTLSCVNSQVYQARGVVMAKFTFHFSPFSDCFCPCHAQTKRGLPAQGKETPLQKMHKKATTAAFLCVVVLCSSVLCYGYCFSFTATAALRLCFGFWLGFGWLGFGSGCLLLLLCLATYHRHYYHLIAIGSK